jgi:hypothetical protein
LETEKKTMKTLSIAVICIIWFATAAAVSAAPERSEADRLNDASERSEASPRERRAPTERRARERVGEFEGRSPSNYHDDYRIIGTLERVTAADIAVKQTKDGKVIAMAWQKTSKVTRDKKPVPRAQLTAGLHVVVNARGDSLLELDIVEVRIVPPPAKK